MIANRALDSVPASIQQECSRPMHRRMYLKYDAHGRLTKETEAARVALQHAHSRVFMQDRDAERQARLDKKLKGEALSSILPSHHRCFEQRKAASRARAKDDAIPPISPT